LGDGSNAVSKDILEDLKLKNFQKSCPTGRITPKEFEVIYSRFFPESNAQTYAQVVFRSSVTLDPDLSFDEHIKTVSRTAFFHLRNIVKIRNFLSKNDPNDDNTPEKRANKVWTFFEKKDNGEKNKVLFNVI
uniref:EF-hand domain-containing protein n=1 Tax=Hucho hucho TaxID=62062 RepID=A0A4W5N2N4_9TELE